MDRQTDGWTDTKTVYPPPPPPPPTNTVGYNKVIYSNNEDQTTSSAWTGFIVSIKTKLSTFSFCIANKDHTITLFEQIRLLFRFFNFAFWVIWMLFCCLWIFFQKLTFSKKNLSGIPSECQTVWIQIRPDICWA